MERNLLDIIESVKESQEQMVTQLHQFCEINSGTENLEGLSRMHAALKAAYSPLADDIQTHPLPVIETINLAGERIQTSFGDALVIRKRPHLSTRILLSGHMDTVFHIDHPFQHLTYLDDNTLNGPGVADMKGGLIVMLHALKAFERSPEAQCIGWDVVINSDEEAGSPASSSLLLEMSKHCHTALVYEPTATPAGALAKNRKGSGKFTVVASGKAAHAGRAFDEGKNAICYLAECVTALHAINGTIPGVTLNIGKIAGGEALNIVPEKAVAMVDVRIANQSDAVLVEAAFKQLLNQHQKPGYHLEIHGGFGRPVKRVNEATKRLFSRIKEIGNKLGLDLTWQDSGGCCDGNNLAQSGLGVIDTLGVRGGALHSHEEYMYIDSLTERATLSALLLIELARNKDE